jgi:hypothetical protein
MWNIHTKSKKVTSIKNEMNKDIHRNLSRRTTEILHKMWPFFNEWGKKNDMFELGPFHTKYKLFPPP